MKNFSIIAALGILAFVPTRGFQNSRIHSRQKSCNKEKITVYGADDSEDSPEVSPRTYGRNRKIFKGLYKQKRSRPVDDKELSEVLRANNELYKAMNKRDLIRMKQVWLQEEEVHCMRPQFHSTTLPNIPVSGYNQVMETWRRIFKISNERKDSRIRRSRVVPASVHAIVQGTTALVTCTEDIHGPSIIADPSSAQKFEGVATSLFRKYVEYTENGSRARWLLVHHHSSLCQTTGSQTDLDDVQDVSTAPQIIVIDEDGNSDQAPLLSSVLEQLKGIRTSKEGKNEVKSIIDLAGGNEEGTMMVEINEEGLEGMDEEDTLLPRTMEFVRKLGDTGRISPKHKSILLNDMIMQAHKGETRSVVEVAYSLIMLPNPDFEDATEDNEMEAESRVEDFAQQCRIFADEIASRMKS